MIDLHCHSNYSDGLLSPQDLLNRALDANLRLLALTDHDTVDGVLLLNQLNTSADLRIINGIELSVRWRKKDIHMVGLGLNLSDKGLHFIIEQQQLNRRQRALQISEKLEELGVDSAFLKACELAGHERIGRPHFAKVLVNENKVKDMVSAFKRFLARGRPAYVETHWIDLDTAVDCIQAAGGHSVLAHPLKYKLTQTKLLELIKEFKDLGGDGMEVVSGNTSEKESYALALIAQKMELLASSGSDFHGDKMSSTSLGRQRALPLTCRPIWQQWIA